TGALYRTVGLFAKRSGIPVDEASRVSRLLGEVEIALRYTEEGQRVILNGEDVSQLIRTPEMSMYASAVSAVPMVRAFLLEIQKKMAADGNVVMDGRDIGTVIMPDADVKLYVEASAKARARRRHEELMEKGDTSTESEVLADIIKRDNNDKNRSIAPAIPADDAIFIDNSDYTPEETLKAALRIIKDKLHRTL
ncbi:MAG: (d)CMP kinase, partial [Ruminococcaceae bacterium]|nr:(d)CMP kinase [Oscillospiraceae bacterium]